MKRSLCGTACNECGLYALCRGCTATCGKPFGKACFVARYLKSGGTEAFAAFKKQLAEEVDSLSVPGLPSVTEWVPVNGRFVNMAYRMPGGQMMTLLSDDESYLACRLPCCFDESSFFSVVAGMDFLLVSLCAGEKSEAELLAYRRR